jgi:hypothetical protein
METQKEKLKAAALDTHESEVSLFRGMALDKLGHMVNLAGDQPLSSDDVRNVLLKCAKQIDDSQTRFDAKMSSINAMADAE